jgi:hypothetical protein
MSLLRLWFMSIPLDAELAVVATPAIADRTA